MLSKDSLSTVVTSNQYDPLEKIPSDTDFETSLMSSRIACDLSRDDAKSSGLLCVQDTQYPFTQMMAPWKVVRRDSNGSTLGDVDGSLETSVTDDEADRFCEDIKFSVNPDEEDSDLDENYFFRDFAPETTQGDRRPSFKRQSRRRSSKARSKLDLAAFAQTLHENRLSVMHPRQSQIILTEEDEQELAKLVAKQRKRLNSMQDAFVPVMPAVSTDWTTQSSQDKETPDKEKGDQGSILETMKVNHVDTQGDSDKVETNELVLSAEPEVLETSVEQDNTMQNEMDPAPTCTSSTIHNDETLASPAIAKLTGSTSLRLPQRKPVIEPLRRPMSAEPSPRNQRQFSLTVSKETNGEQEPPTPTLQSTNTLDSNVNHEDTMQKSANIDDVHHQLQQQGWKLSVRKLKPQSRAKTTPSVLTEREESTKEQIDDEPQEIEPVEGYQSSPTVETKKKEEKLGLFGSLRHAAHRGGRVRSNTIRGLMRSFSTAGGLNRHQRQESEKDSDQDQAQSLTQDKTHGMSPAALAVIQHNVALQKQQKGVDEAPSTESTLPATEAGNPVNGSSPSVIGSNRLVSQLISRATKSKRTTKKVNMPAKSEKRSQVVRRTIIYVQPDSLNALKNYYPPPPPLPPKDRPSLPSMVESCDTLALAEYTTATKIGRQTSVRKRLVESDTSRQQTSSDRNAPSQKRWRLVDSSSDEESEAGTEKTTGGDKPNKHLEGLELREMSDGSVVWGIVKKQGNRKSFFASEALQQYLPTATGGNPPVEVEVEEDDAHIEEHVLTLMGLDPSTLTQKSPSLPTSPTTPSLSHLSTHTPTSPPPIPRRSPRRMTTGSAEHRRMAEPVASSPARVATPTDIYYAPRNTLPSLLQMMAETRHGSEDENDIFKQGMSVEEQLDAMMRSLSSHRI